MVLPFETWSHWPFQLRMCMANRDLSEVVSPKLSRKRKNFTYFFEFYNDQSVDLGAPETAVLTYWPIFDLIDYQR